MQGIERVYCNVCISAVVKALNLLLHTTAEEALNAIDYGKSDTLGFDGIPEYVIMNTLKEFDQDAILITEETDDKASKHWPTDRDPSFQPKMFFSDPTDRSKYLKRFLEEISKGDLARYKKIGDLLNEQDAIKVWEKKVAEEPASITGATSAITFINKGKPVFVVIINFITQELIVACDPGIVKIKLGTDKNIINSQINLDYIIAHGQPLFFPPAELICNCPDDYKRFVTFLGKQGYKENFEESQIIKHDYEKFLHHNEPGGPARILYLSNLQTEHGPIGFILANGEKIMEWIHWLPFVKFAKNSQGNPALKIFEVVVKRPSFKDNILMSTPAPYSIFNLVGKDNHYINLSCINNFKHPSRFRGTIVITRSDNLRINSIIELHNYRDVSSCL